MQPGHFFVPESDHLTLLNVYQHGSDIITLARGAEIILHVKGLRKAREVRSSSWIL